MNLIITHWQGQDTLNLNEEEWIELLSDTEIFDEIGLKMVTFVYVQPDYQSSATEIGKYLGGVSLQQVTAWNRRISRSIYKNLVRNRLSIIVVEKVIGMYHLM